MQGNNIYFTAKLPINTLDTPLGTFIYCMN